MTYNLDLMRAVREQITKHPETHDQTSWGERTECGTTHCIAGWACALSGDAFEWAADAPGVDLALLVTAPRAHVDVRAAELLGLDSIEAGDVFYALDNASALEQLDELIERGEREA